MTVFLNARFLTQPLSGVQRHARELVAALDRRLARDAALRQRLGGVVALHPAGAVVPQWAAIDARVLPGGSGHVWEQLRLGPAARGGTLLSLCGSGPLGHRRHVVAFHDANLWHIPEAFDWRYRLFHRALRPRLAQRAVARLSVSAHAAATLEEVLGVKDFTVVPNSAEHVLRHPAEPGFLIASGLGHGGYLLAIGSDSPNKNLGRLVAAHRLAGTHVPPLVIAGGGVTCLTADKTLEPAPPPDGIRVLGRVSDGELRALYEGAAGFVFPSLHEGFGIPPLEAMTMGTPVLAARSSALPEVLGKAALWFNPRSVPDMARALSRLADMTPAERANLVAAGHRQAARHSWDASADVLCGVLEQIVPATGTTRARNLPPPVTRPAKPDEPCPG